MPSYAICRLLPTLVKNGASRSVQLMCTSLDKRQHSLWHSRLGICSVHKAALLYTRQAEAEKREKARQEAAVREANRRAAAERSQQV